MVERGNGQGEGGMGAQGPPEAGVQLLAPRVTVFDSQGPRNLDRKKNDIFIYTN